MIQVSGQMEPVKYDKVTATDQSNFLFREKTLSGPKRREEQLKSAE